MAEARKTSQILPKHVQRHPLKDTDGHGVVLRKTSQEHQYADIRGIIFSPFPENRFHGVGGEQVVAVQDQDVISVNM